MDIRTILCACALVILCAGGTALPHRNVTAVELSGTDPSIFDTNAFKLEELVIGGKGANTGIVDLGLPALSPSLAAFINTTQQIPASIKNESIDIISLL